MSDNVYYPVTVCSVLFLAVTACLIPNVEVVITLISGLCVTCISFFLPGVFYIMSSNKIEKKEGTQPNPQLKVSAYLQLLLGACVLVGSVTDSTNQIIAILNKK